MALRVTQHTMYNNMVGHMQQNLSSYMESVQQGSSQKKINRPSDDPAGTYRVLTTRNDIVATGQYQENVDTAKGWLNLADSVLSTNVTTAITGLKTLAEQASTGTYSAEQRLMMADQARQYFGQLLNLSNTQFEDMHLFAGHKYASSAFQQGLAATSWDPGWDSAINNGQVQVSGASERTVLIEFVSQGNLAEGMVYKWSNDAGVTWNTDTVKVEKTADDKPVYRLQPTGAGVTIDIPIATNNDGTVKYVYTDADGNRGYATEAGLEYNTTDGVWNVKDGNGNVLMDADGKPITATPAVMVPNPDYDKYAEDGPENPKEIPLYVMPAVGADENSSEGEEAGAKNGTFLYIRPAAFYQGDDKDPPVDVTVMGAGQINKNSTPEEISGFVSATGSFGGNMLVRINGAKNPQTNEYSEPVDLFDNPGQEFSWSYSTDGGSTWVTATAKTSDTSQLRLPVPGGYVDFNVESFQNKELTPGMQINVHPSRSDLNYEIMKDTYLSVNSVGKDVFGGYYNGKPAMDDNDYNLFEVVGSFIGYLEGNNQEGCQRTLAALTKAEQKILAEATRIGGMENRVEMAADVLSFQKLDQQERLSYTEDIDLTELLTKLTRQQLTYQTVLQSSSMIMQLSLAKYL